MNITKYLMVFLVFFATLELHAQVSWREATPAEAAAATMGPPAVLTPRRGGGGGGGSATNVSLGALDNTITITTNSSSSWSLKVGASVVTNNQPSVTFGEVKSILSFDNGDDNVSLIKDWSGDTNHLYWDASLGGFASEDIWTFGDLGNTPLNASELTFGTIPLARLPSSVLTNGGSASFSSVTMTNTSFFGSVTGLASAIPTNYTVIPDFRLGESSYTSNGIIVLGAPINVSTNYNHWVLHAKNSTGSVLAIVPRTDWVSTNGVWNYTNLSLIHVWTDQTGTNAVCVPVK